MRRFLSYLLSLSTGVLLGVLACHLPRLYPTDSVVIPIQVAPGESWAAAWDVANGEEIPLDQIPESPVVHLYDPQKNRSGAVLADGSCVVYRLDQSGWVKSAVIAKRLPVLPTKGRITAK